jgi:hypothetical protein
MEVLLELNRGGQHLIATVNNGGLGDSGYVEEGQAYLVDGRERRARPQSPRGLG